MKKTVVLLIVLAVVGITQLNAQAKSFIDQPYVEVAGTADTLVTPNEIFIRFTISEKDTKNKVSLQDQEKAMYAALQQLGIDVNKNLVVNDMSSNFQYYFLRGKDVVKTRDYVLKVNTANDAGKVFITLEQLNIANAAIDRVDYNGLEAIRNKIRSNAVKNAYMRAKALTEPLNQNIGRAIYIGDDERYTQPYTQPRIMLAKTMVSDETTQPDISFEKIKVSANITVRFVLN
jgi:uncharacterized protein YggE